MGALKELNQRGPQNNGFRRFHAVRQGLREPDSCADKPREQLQMKRVKQLATNTKKDRESARAGAVIKQWTTTQRKWSTRTTEHRRVSAQASGGQGATRIPAVAGATTSEAPEAGCADVKVLPGPTHKASQAPKGRGCSARDAQTREASKCNVQGRSPVHRHCAPTPSGCQ